VTAVRRLLAALLPLALLAGCTSFTDTVAAGSSPSASPSATPSASTSANPTPGGRLHCPAARSAPDPHRPRIAFDFRLSDDLRTVTGTETVGFTPDRPTAELVFRLVPNGPDSAAAGNRLTVDSVQGDDVRGGGYEAAGAQGPGGLYRVALRRRLAAGDSTRVLLSFTLTLGAGSFDRFGTDAGTSWWASGAPLLAWEPGVGWARDPFVGVQGETATSPAADTAVSVSAPAALTVLMTGNQDPPSEPRSGRRTWTSTEQAARDVSVAVGAFTTRDATTAEGVRVTVGVLPGSGLTADRLADWTTSAVTELAGHLGPFPYRTLTVPYLGDYGGGIEYPSSILLAAGDRPVLVHEVAHMWFYGMVGDDQYRDPWLDEAFASFAEKLVDPLPDAAVDQALAQPGDVGDAIGAFPDSNRYFSVVYGKGEAALLTARRTAGPAVFDAAVRCYVNANAWTIATPADVGAALADLPAATDVLVRAGALQPGDVPR
jgi:hypothetical protein